MPAGGPRRPYRQRVTLADYFVEFADSPAPYLQHDDGYRSWEYTYAQVGAAARNFSVKLQSEGIGKGDKVIFWSENRPEWVAAFWGCVIAGVIVVPIDYRTSGDFLGRVHDKVKARAILIGDEVGLQKLDKFPAVWRISNLDWASSCSTRPAVTTKGTYGFQS